jgi:hypothetical protein
VDHQGIGQKQDRTAKPNNAFAEFDIFHRGTGKSFVESLDRLKKTSANGDITAPKTSTIFVDRGFFIHASLLPVGPDPTFGRDDGRIFETSGVSGE